MKKIRLHGILLYSIFMAITGYGQNSKTTDFLGLPGPVSFDGKSYRLAWSSHPTPQYYKQEYIIAGDQLDKFNTMILVEVLMGSITPGEAANAKRQEKSHARLNRMPSPGTRTHAAAPCI
ncbi:MAG: hypothetical protein EOO00_12685, partial [Chitinophagaceae bacterium]